MERVKWEKPRAEVQAFVADDYVAVCYTLTCDAGKVGWFDQQTIYRSKDILTLVDTAYGHNDRNDYYTVRQVDEPTVAKNGFIILANGWKPEWKPVFYWTDSSGYHLSTESAYVAHKNVS